MLAQTTEPTGTYARATYLKTKPGKAAEHAEYVEKTAPKGAAAIIGGGAATGYVSLRRVFPLSSEAGHDVLYFYTNAGARMGPVVRPAS